jgi:hypothetical protein
MIPSGRESAEAISAARKALEDFGRFWLGHIQKVEKEFLDLDLWDESDRFMAIDIALSEITPTDRLGPNPPNDFSSHPPFLRQRLFAFCWSSAHFGQRMYFKFAVVGDTKIPRLVVYSLHEARF